VLRRLLLLFYVLVMQVLGEKSAGRRAGVGGGGLEVVAGRGAWRTSRRQGPGRPACCWAWLL
jgi:hypothetical protein